MSVIDRRKAGAAIGSMLRDESGQDLVEYVLLVAFFALATIGGFRAIETAIANAYPTWDQGVQSLSEPCDPGRASDAAGSCTAPGGGS